MQNKIRILFVGEIHSSHAQNWISLFTNNQECFEIAFQQIGPLAHPRRQSLKSKIYRALKRKIIPKPSFQNERLYSFDTMEEDLNLCLKACKTFNPTIVHTFGIQPSALLWSEVIKLLKHPPIWVLQTRGGSDVAYTRFKKEWIEFFKNIIPKSDLVICDNNENYNIFNSLGIDYKRPTTIQFIPGTGGIDLSEFSMTEDLHERERLIIWNKAYECPWSKALPVLEGIRLAWDSIRPARFIFTAVDDEVRNYLTSLPKDLQNSIQLEKRISRSDLLQLMQKARVILAPSIVDGIPNTLYESMAAGAIPVVSPLASIIPIFQENLNVLYARNIYPDEICQALKSAINDDSMTHIQKNNYLLIKEIGDKKKIKELVKDIYIGLITK